MNTDKTNKKGSEAKAKEETTTIKLGLDVHAAQITVCRQMEGLGPQPPQKMGWEQFLKWIKEQVGRGAKVHSCYEAGPCGYGLHRTLQSMGVENLVVVPQRWDSGGQRVKTDKRDARELVDRLDRYLRGNTKVFAVVKVPSQEQDQRRCVARQRAAALKERNRCVVRGHGMMLAQGMQAPSGWWRPKRWEEFGAKLPVWLHGQVALWQKKAIEFEEEVSALEKEISLQSCGKGLPKGLGRLTSALLGAEVLDWKRFKNRRQVASYTGLCPGENSSGERRGQGSITKHGNPRIRHHLVEAVWRLERWQPEYAPIKKLHEVKTGRSRKRMAVAAARRLAIDLWRIETGQCSAQSLGLELMPAAVASKV
jgi:transposase